jgi:hypothetical protein
MAEHQRRYVVRWLNERLTGRPERGDLLYELKRWLYEHRILIGHDRLLMLTMTMRACSIVLGRQSTHQMGDVFTKIVRLYAIGVHEGWLTLCNDAAVRHYARWPPSMSKPVNSTNLSGISRFSCRSEQRYR